MFCFPSSKTIGSLLHLCLWSFYNWLNPIISECKFFKVFYSVRKIAEVINQKLDYIHNNPVKEGVVEFAEQYVFSSAIDYADGLGLLTIENVNG